MTCTWNISLAFKTCCTASAFMTLMGWSQAGLIQHLDATVAGSVVTDESGVVTQWFDQSGSGNNAADLADYWCTDVSQREHIGHGPPRGRHGR